MQLDIERPLGRHRLRDVAHVKNLTLCCKHSLGNYLVIVCQVCFRQKNICPAHSEELSIVCTLLLNVSVFRCMHASVSLSLLLSQGNMRREVVSSLHPQQNTDCNILPN